MFKTDKEKGEIFGEILATTFSPYLDFKNCNKPCEIVDTNQSFLNKKEQNFFNEPITVDELKNSLNKLKDTAGPGLDLNHIQMLKNLPSNTLYEIIDLFNLSLENGIVPLAWKIAKISMIPKKTSLAQDPSNYRFVTSTNYCERSEHCKRVGL